MCQNNTIPQETIKRSSLKSFLWRIVGVIILASVTFFYTHSWFKTSWITFLHHGIFFFVFIAHERFWLHIDFTGLKRKLLKMMTYETILGNFILAIISLIITGNIQSMTKITLSYIGIKHVIYIFNEFIWERIKWGLSGKMICSETSQ
jgi:uncharacterized membrane protein